MRSVATTLFAPAGQSTPRAAACRRIPLVRFGLVTFCFKGPASKTVDWILAAVSIPGCVGVVARGRQVHRKGRCTPRSAFRRDVGVQVKTPSERLDGVDACCRADTKRRRRRSGAGEGALTSQIHAGVGVVRVVRVAKGTIDFQNLRGK